METRSDSKPMIIEVVVTPNDNTSRNDNSGRNDGGHVIINTGGGANDNNINGNSHQPSSLPTVDEARGEVVVALNPEVTQTQQVLNRVATIQTSFDKRISWLSEILVNIPSNPQVESLPSPIFTPTENSESNSNNLQKLKIEMTDLIAKGDWNGAKALAVKSVEETERSRAASTAQLIEKLSKTIDDKSQFDSVFDLATPFEKAVLYSLSGAAAIAVVPEAVGGAIGSLVTALAIGPVAEGLTLEVLANPAFMQAASRAGALIGGGKLLNTFGIFDSVPAEAIVGEHPLTGMTIQQVIQRTNTLGLKTPKDSYLLYSGLGEGGAGIKISQEFAEKNGYITLEMTPGGKWLSGMNLFGKNSPFNKGETIKIWKEVSILAMAEASGRIQAVTGAYLPGSIYFTELRVMGSNEKITGFEELTIQPRILILR